MDKERRRYKRYNSTLTVKIHLEDDTHTQAVAQSQNLSREGMRITTNTHIPIKSVVNLEITSADGEETFHAEAKVIWAQKVAQSEHDIEYGVNFMKIDPIEKFHMIDKTIKQHLEGNEKA
jgi:c-di-GMP-binding flagellar brake protein YcgR